MHLVSEDINDYCLSRSSAPSSVCEDLQSYTQQNVPYSRMISGGQVGSLLGFLVRLIGAERVLEIGTFTGYSALAMAENLPPHGTLVTLDVDPETNAIAKRFWAKSPHGAKIQSLLQPALEALKTIEGKFDFVFIDADKTNYLNYLKAVLPRLSPKGVIVADNTLWSGRVLQAPAPDADTAAIQAFNDFVKASPDLQSTLLPVRDGLHLIRRINPS